MTLRSLVSRSLVLFIAICCLASPLVAQRARGVNPPRVPPQQQPPAPQTPPQQPPPAPAAGAIGSPFASLPAHELTLFANGRAEFTEIEDVSDGLGPVFNERSCAACHNAAAAGGAGRRNVTRIGRVVNGVFDALTSLGGSLLQDRAIGLADGSPHQFQPETVPGVAMIVAHRRTTPLFGLGLVDATPDEVFIALAHDEAARNDGTAGRVAVVDNIRAGMQTVGKFGWKAQVPTLAQFAGDAYLNEMGITSPDFTAENCPRGDCNELAFNPQPALNDTGEGVRALTDFMRFLGAPLRGAITADVTAGERVFQQIGCTSCHVATLRSGRSEVAALSDQTYHPYSDFLLHDMGSLGDGIPQGAASAREFRTAPLWGVSRQPSLLHDGRATTLDGAILAHDGQGRASRDRFNRLDDASKRRLIEFLRSL